MNTKILKLLDEVEKDKCIKILLSVESGSRAWGFPSPDSDFDIRMIYVHDKNWYLSIEEQKDTLEFFQGKLLDVNGWDLRKVLKLTRKSNVTPFEWNQSPIIYRENPTFQKELMKLSKYYFDPVHSLNHYFGIGKNTWESILATPNFKLKKLFYVIRPVFASKWIMGNNSLPPMNLFELMKGVVTGPFDQYIYELIAQKASIDESQSLRIDAKFMNWLDGELNKINEARKRIVPIERKSMDKLNEYFYKILEENKL